MTKTKGEEAATSDGLEIISIGSLYKGSWDKKYWSSSRGKDRYPYPVGYQAFRAYNGSTYKMEIAEGHKGPLFVISCDGQSCSGQTPDIVWENFQKKGCTNLKIWHGKRFSCKIDGVEFFGFKNPLVQRFLRELVANINGTAEGSLLPSSICNDTSRIGHDNQISNICTSSDLLPHFARSKIRKKQSTRCEITQSQSITVPDLKRPRSKKLTHDGKASNLIQQNLVQPKYGIQMPHSAAKQENDKLAGALPEAVQSSSLNDGFPFPVGSPNVKSTRINCTSEECPQQITPSGQALWTKGVVINHNISADDCTNAVSGARTIAGSVKEELTADNVVISDDLVTYSHQEEETGTSNSNTWSDKSDFDSVDEEMAKLMMSVLLPQAIPLLKRNSKKKRKTTSQSKVSRDDSINYPSSAIIPAAEAQAERDTIMHVQSIDQGPIVPVLEYVNSIVLDSFDDGHGEGKGEDHIDKQAVLLSKEKLVSTPVKQETSACGDESCGNHDTFCHKEVNVASEKMSQEGELTISRSEDTQVIHVNLDENSHDLSVEKEPKNEPNCAEALGTNDDNPRCIESPLQLSGNDFSTVTRVPKDCHQVPSKVYTRKKISTQDYSTRKYIVPLSESIIFRNSGDNYAPNVSSSIGTSLVSKSCHSSDDKTCDIDTFDAIQFTEGQSYGLPVEKKTSISCKPERSSVPSDVSNQNQKGCTTEIKDVSCYIDASVLLERSQENGSKESLEDRNITENGCGTSCQNQLNSFCDKGSSTAGEVQCSSDFNTSVELNSDLRDIVNLVGGYLHSLPISSVLLGAKGNELHICVSCGLPAYKERKLFIYKIAIEEPRIGCPSFVGYTSVTLPFSEIGLERCGLQFTPDGQCLVLLNSIKTPYCREGRTDCTCSMCSSGSSKENAIKIVLVNPGYVSLIAKLETSESLQCILACENNHLVAAGESGRLHLWVMNLTWSAWIEECSIPAGDCISSCVVELKRIPNCASLVIGHNVFGEFILWDIMKRVIVSSFSACSNPIKQFLPISLVNWKPAFSYADMNGHLDEIITASKVWLSEHKDRSSLQLEGEDIAVWLLISTVFDMNAQHENASRWWRLALLVKNSVILGSTLDPRAATVGALFNHAIMGRDDGLVYMWELSTGTQLGVLHHFKGGSVSCIATHDLRPDVLAIAADNGQLLVYQHSQPRKF